MTRIEVSTTASNPECDERVIATRAGSLSYCCPSLGIVVESGGFIVPEGYDAPGGKTMSWRSIVKQVIRRAIDSETENRQRQLSIENKARHNHTYEGRIPV